MVSSRVFDPALDFVQNTDSVFEGYEIMGQRFVCRKDYFDVIKGNK